MTKREVLLRERRAFIEAKILAEQKEKEGLEIEEFNKQEATLRDQLLASLMSEGEENVNINPNNTEPPVQKEDGVDQVGLGSGLELGLGLDHNESPVQKENGVKDAGKLEGKELISEEKREKEVCKEREEEREGEEERSIHSFGCEGSWLSLPPLTLHPGEYVLYVHISFNVPVETLMSESKKGRVVDKPWLEGNFDGPSIWVQCSTARMEGIELTDIGVESTTANDLSKEEDSLKYEREVTESTEREVEGLEYEGESSDSQEREEEALDSILAIERNVLNITIAGTYPFLEESQKEVATKGLYSLLSDLREESEHLASQFISSARRLKKIKKYL
jgi:hypothetical protein